MMLKTGDTWAEGEKKGGQESAGSVLLDVDPHDLENININVNINRIEFNNRID